MKDLEDYIAKCEANGKPDSEIDLTDIPELTEEDFARGYFKYRKLPKKAMMFSIDIDNLDWLQSFGKKDYQTRINYVLRWARMNNCQIPQS
ncbi:BrnA antitoxin family protein [Treponema sp. OMZ 840]|uniref:BrnA antitoxin family protein n=1 Tax=Treponema sp. OMZ 840 TaxID=244313 RepID=UPI003D8B6ECF